MRIKVITNSRVDERPDDVERIQNVLHENGYEATLDECADMWEMYSDSMCAGWMVLPEDDEDLFWNIRPYFE